MNLENFDKSKYEFSQSFTNFQFFQFSYIRM